jgi:(4-O-methyl)-D-glucuronate---lignin esterase
MLENTTMLQNRLPGLIALVLVALTQIESPPTVMAADANYDESMVPAYTLPDPLVFSDGTRVARAEEWRRKRRPEILELFRTHMYGRSPGKPEHMTFAVLETDRQALGGKATRKRVSIRFLGRADGPAMELLIYLPNPPGDAKSAGKPGEPSSCPLFVGIHLFPKSASVPNPGVPLADVLKKSQGKPAALTLPSPAGRGGSRDLPAERLAETILARGYGLATIDAADLAPDSARDYLKGVISTLAPNEAPPAAGDAWGAISAWAWGLSRAMDYFEFDNAIDARRIVVIGHSRMGKTALWAAAQDERFAVAVSNDSGCGGAALSRRQFGETVELINQHFPHWFCDNFKRYNGREDTLPVDQHMLIALIAPRGVYVASAQEDRWADPRGEFLAVLAAEPVYRLLGKEGLGVSDVPPVNKPVVRSQTQAIGYHVRSGGHAMTDFDWLAYLDFVDRQFAGKSAKE